MRIYEIETPNEIAAAFNNDVAADDDGWDTGTSSARTAVVNQEQQLMAMYKLVEEKLTTYCKPYLQAVGGIENALFNTALYRGVRPEEIVDMDMTTRDPIKVINVRQDRIPTDTPAEVHQMVDDWFERKTGYRFRGASLFTVGRRASAAGYGYPVAVIPVGEFHFCWSPVVKDMFHQMTDYIGQYVGPDYTQDISNKSKIRNFFDSEGKVNEFLKESNYKFDTDLKGAIQSSHEVMVVCNKAIILDTEWLNRVHFQLLHNN